MTAQHAVTGAPTSALGTGAVTLGAMVLTAGARYGDRPALRHKVGSRWEDVSYAELAGTARGIARGLIALGIEPGDRVSVLGDTRPEWTLADLGSFCAGAVVAPIYHTNAPEECAYVLRHSDARVLFCEDAAQLAKIEAVREHCPLLEHVVLLEGEHPGALSLAGLLERGADIPASAVEDRVRDVGAVPAPG